MGHPRFNVAWCQTSAFIVGTKATLVVDTDSVLRNGEVIVREMKGR
jgi:hypothetical protein